MTSTASSPQATPCTTADNHPVKFTYHNGQWQAEVKEYAAKGSWQHRQLPVVFEPGFTLEDLVDSNPTEQKKLLHICPDEDNAGSYRLYICRQNAHPSKDASTTFEQPSSKADSPARREVGLAQQQAIAHPQQARTSLQQGQEQPGPASSTCLNEPLAANKKGRAASTSSACNIQATTNTEQ